MCHVPACAPPSRVATAPSLVATAPPSLSVSPEDLRTSQLGRGQQPRREARAELEAPADLLQASWEQEPESRIGDGRSRKRPFGRGRKTASDCQASGTAVAEQNGPAAVRAALGEG